MNDREKLIELLAKYFTIGCSYEYTLTRVKEAFAIGTVDLDDFVEFDDEKVSDIADYLIASGVTVQKHGQWIYVAGKGTRAEYECNQCCGHVRFDEKIDGSIPPYKHCPNCGADMREAEA